MFRNVDYKAASVKVLRGAAYAGLVVTEWSSSHLSSLFAQVVIWCRRGKELLSKKNGSVGAGRSDKTAKKGSVTDFPHTNRRTEESPCREERIAAAIVGMDVEFSKKPEAPLQAANQAEESLMPHADAVGPSLDKNGKLEEASPGCYSESNTAKLVDVADHSSTPQQDSSA